MAEIKKNGRRRSRRVPAGAIATLVRAMEAVDVPTAPLLARLRVERAALFEPRARVSVNKIGLAYVLAMQTRLPDEFWLDLGNSVSVHGYYLDLSNWILTAKNLDAVIPVLYEVYGLPEAVRNASRLRGQLPLSIVPILNRQWMGVAVEGAPDDPLHHHAAELLAATATYGLRTVLGFRDVPVEIDFGYPEPPHGDHYRAVLGDAITFDAPRTRVRVSTAVGKRPIPTHDAAMHEAYFRELEDEFFSGHPDAGLMREVRAALASTDDFPTMVEMCRTLKVSERSLRRKLQAQGTSYRALVMEAKMARAAHLLERPQLSVEQVGARLGFSDYSNFRRAFTRWYGVSPSRYRSQPR